MKLENKFDSVFRQKAREIKIKPSRDVWHGIDDELSRRKRTSVYSIIAIAASLLLLVGFFGLYVAQDGDYQNPNYHVQQLDEDNNASYDAALMEWVAFNRNSEARGEM